MQNSTRFRPLLSVFSLIAALCCPPVTGAQVYEKLYDFGDARAQTFAESSNNASSPSAGLVQGLDGNFYGTTGRGGTSNYGTVFKMTPAGVLTMLVEFTGAGTNKGINPEARLVQGNDGNFYGTTGGGGSSGRGTVFKMTPTGVLTTLVNFTGSGGSYIGGTPQAELVQGSDGSFYGTTAKGGANDAGTIFKMTPGGVLTTLVEFTGNGTANKGSEPYAGLVQGSDGNFYGTTRQGGASNYGTVFKITSGGVLTTLVEFTGNGASNKGSLPYAGLLQGSDGNFYGTTSGINTGNGTVFKMTPSGVLTTLVNFTGNGASNKGSSPQAGLVQGSDGNFYGTTTYGGANGAGTVFKMTPNGVLTTLVEFTGNGTATKGAGLVQGSDGNFYGTTQQGGTSGAGTVFKIAPGGALTTLVQFAGVGTNNVGTVPYAGLLQGNDGNFYGTTALGGAGDVGTIFKMTPGGVLTTLVNFTGNGASNKGSNPYAELLEGSDGDFYGATYSGGANSVGTVFKITPSGVLTTLVEFTGNGTSNKGSFPYAGLVQGSDGNFYGTTGQGGTSNYGTVFKITSGGVLTTLVEFSGNGTVNKGSSPYAGLVQGSDGNFYGTTRQGGANDVGTVFKMTPGGVLTTLVEFTGFGTSNKGSRPIAGLLQGSDGSFYGATSQGGANSNYGTVFKVTPGGVLTTLEEFTSAADRDPFGTLIRGADGCLYGTSKSEGSGGIIYRLVFPGTPLVLDVSHQAPGKTSLILEAKVNPRGAATNVTLEYGGDGVNFPNSVAVANGISGNQLKLVGTTLENLTPATVYYYRFRAVSSAGTTVSPVANLLTLAEPVVATAPASEIAATSARFNGTVNARNYDTTVVFEWGTDGNSFPNTAPAVPGTVTGNTNVAVNAAVAGLVKGQTYYYRIAANNAAGNVTSGVQSFITLTDPVVTTGASTVQNASSASITGTVDARGTSANVVFEYATNPGFTGRLSTPAVPSPVTGVGNTAVSATLTGLASGTTYFYRVVATSAGGTGTGSAGTFTTPSLPVVAASSASSIGVASATFNGTANAIGLSTTVVFEYGTDGVSFPNSLTASPSTVTGSSNVAVSATVGGLTAGTTYYYRVRGTSSAGTVVSPSVVQFTTLVAPTATMGTAGGVTATSATVAGVVNARGTSTDVAFEYGTDGVTFPLSATAAPSPVAGNSDTTVSTVLSGLAQNTTYYFRVRGTSVAGTATGSAGSFTTLQLPVVTIGPASGVSVAGATLSGTVNAQGSDTTVSVEVSSDAGFTAANTLAASPGTVTGNGATAVSASLGSLPASTTFYYRFRAVSAAGVVVSNASSFTTPNPPAVTVVAASSVTATSAQVNGTVDAAGATAAVSFEIASDAAFTNPGTIAASPSQVSGTGSTAVSALATGLQSGGTYYFRLKATGPGGSTTSATSGTFTTLALPMANLQPAEAISSLSATLKATVDAKGADTTVVFEYGPNQNSFPFSIAGTPSQITGSGLTNVSASISGLTPQTTYYYRVRATSNAGTSIGGPLSFATQKSANVTTVSGSATLDGATLTATVDGFGLTTSVFFDYGTDPELDTVDGTVPGNQQASAETNVSAFIPVGTNLVSDTTYYFRARAQNQAGTTLGSIKSFRTQLNHDPAVAADVVFYSGQVQFNPLENDSDSDVASGVDPKLKIAPVLVREPEDSGSKAIVSEDGKSITYTPGNDSSREDTLAYRVLDPYDGQAVGEVRLIDFSLLAGYYSGVIPGSGGNGKRTAMAIQLTGGGAVTTSFMDHDHERYPLKGVFGSNGRLSGVFGKAGEAGTTITLTFQLLPDPILVKNKNVRAINATVQETVNGVSSPEIPFQLIQGFGGATGGGRLTAHIEHNSLRAVSDAGNEEDAEAVSVGGDGYVVMTIGKDKLRRARVVGRLPDGEPFSSGGLAPFGKTYQMGAANLYRRGAGGMLAGQINVLTDPDDTATEDTPPDPLAMLSNMTWRRRASDDPVYPKGIVSRIDMEGLIYPDSVPNGLLEILGNTATLTLSGADLPAPSLANNNLQVGLIIVSPTVVQVAEPNPLKVKFKANPNTALYTGSFIHPSTRKVVKFSGAIQAAYGSAPASGRGCFLSKGMSGSARVETSP